MQKNIIIKNLTLAETIAHRNPEVANELLIKNGYPHSPDRDVLAKNLNHFLLTQRDNALSKLANIHPDKAIIMSANGVDINEPYENDNADGDDNFDGGGTERRALPQNRNKNRCKNCGGKHYGANGYSNCCGSNADGDEFSNCSGGCGGNCNKKYSNAAGDKTQAQIPGLINKEMLAIVGVIGIVMIGLIAISRPQTQKA